ncbi:cytochrome c oxidase subunit 6C-like [Anoplophora glabripennis]|uniref:cytochrome c oxidase subunit 6C-like n=1 Tax=Anoplophora glabripennis TaxID=217634 RepID=UPI000874A6B2|nr:cytochrome c oxidase subunit 6C-like [Anoplophora glabripennis]
MSEVTTKISKPNMRRLLYNQIKKNLIATGVSVLIAGVYMRFVFSDNNRRDYANFYKSYDINKEFETMRKKGLFDSCDPED